VWDGSRGTTGDVTEDLDVTTLVGLSAGEAEARIESAGLVPRVVPHDAVITMEFRYDRVTAVLDEDGVVVEAGRY
jgi:hypothetical protein